MTSTECFKAVVLLLLMHCLLLPPLFCGVCVYGSCFVVQYLVSFAIISLGKREREREKAGCLTLIAFKCYLTVGVLCLFLTEPWVSLQCVIVALPGHIYFSIRFFMKLNFKNQHLEYCQQGLALLCANRINDFPKPSCYPVRNPIEQICDVIFKNYQIT